jgi:hypothetical protein
MPRERLFGSDVPFMEWCRNNKLLPAWSPDIGWVQTDVDTFIHRYITAVDGVSSRELQVMMEVEVKTRGGDLTPSQRDTYRKKHATIQPSLKWQGQSLRNFGVSILRMSGTSPADSAWMKWCRFKAGQGFETVEKDITEEQLVLLLRFELHPDTLDAKPFRRHHKTNRFFELKKTPLGFVFEREIVKRS